MFRSKTLFEFARRALSELADERRRQKAMSALEALNDHLLADIGLRRDQLPIFSAMLADDADRLDFAGRKPPRQIEARPHNVADARLPRIVGAYEELRANG